ncbi:NAD(P)-dependent oxidoreductase [Odoribacter laneus]|uniref:NAD(P)-dependent oxidoreductase n=1 Tax=Odoribacter laneus TaxID=626933 RepID=UPI003AB470D7
MKILVTYDIPREPFKNLPTDWEITFPEGEKLTKEEIIRMLPEYDILLAIFSRPIDKEIIDAGKKLKLISNYGVGYNNIDIQYARKKGITVCNTPESVCNPTAELCMALLLGIARRIGEFDRRIRTEKEGMWGVMKNLGYGLKGKTLGIIGMGHIGQNVACKAAAFGMNILYYNRKTEVPGYKKTDLDSLLKESDFISIHTPLTEATHHLIGERELGLMKKTAFLINTARGAVIDEEVLSRFLEKRQIAGAALDVFEREPHITELLYSLDNVILVPHIGTATYDGRIAMAQEALDNIRNYLNGKPTNVVN